MIPSLHSSPTGFSESERYLGEIAERAFLTFWSHPNLFRTRAKELADLVIIFGNDIIIFSDKSCEYKPGPHGWSRWHKRAVLESAHQLWRAERWIREHPTKIFTDSTCEKPFPFPVPRAPAIHLVAVATGAHDGSVATGRDGSLSIATDSDGSTEFTIGDIDRNKPFVHVFDDICLTMLLDELDTAADFLSYIKCREAFLRSGPAVWASGERDLLAHYLNSYRNGRHDFVIPYTETPPTCVIVDEDWDEFQLSEKYARKKEADAESYLWDRLIENVASHADRGSLVVGQELGLVGTEGLLRLLASENRFRRRLLARHLNELRRLSTTGPEDLRMRSVFDADDATRAYVFCVLRRGRRKESDYRSDRRSMMLPHLIITKSRRSELREVIGIAVGPANDPDESIDVAARTFDSWDDDAQAQAEQLCEKLGWDRDTLALEHHQHAHEYPIAPPSERRIRPATTSKRPSGADSKRKRQLQKRARKKARR